MQDKETQMLDAIETVKLAILRGQLVMENKRFVTDHDATRSLINILTKLNIAIYNAKGEISEAPEEQIAREDH